MIYGLILQVSYWGHIFFPLFFAQCPHLPSLLYKPILIGFSPILVQKTGSRPIIYKSTKKCPPLKSDYGPPTQEPKLFPYKMDYELYISPTNNKYAKSPDPDGNKRIAERNMVQKNAHLEDWHNFYKLFRYTSEDYPGTPISSTRIPFMTKSYFPMNDKSPNKYQFVDKNVYNSRISDILNTIYENNQTKASETYEKYIRKYLKLGHYETRSTISQNISSSSGKLSYHAIDDLEVIRRSETDKLYNLDVPNDYSRTDLKLDISLANLEYSFTTLNDIMVDRDTSTILRLRNIANLISPFTWFRPLITRQVEIKIKGYKIFKFKNEFDLSETNVSKNIAHSYDLEIGPKEIFKSSFKIITNKNKYKDQQREININLANFIIYRNKAKVDYNLVQAGKTLTYTHVDGIKYELDQEKDSLAIVDNEKTTYKLITSDQNVELSVKRRNSREKKVLFGMVYSPKSKSFQFYSSIFGSNGQMNKMTSSKLFSNNENAKINIKDIKETYYFQVHKTKSASSLLFTIVEKLINFINPELEKIDINLYNQPYYKMKLYLKDELALGKPS